MTAINMRCPKYMHVHVHVHVLCTHMETRQNHSSIGQHTAETRLYTTGDAVGSGYIRTFPTLALGDYGKG